MKQWYDGDGLRGKKEESTPTTTTTYYLRSSVLGGQVVAEVDGNGAWTRGFVYLGGQMIAIQSGTSGAVNWVHQDPVTKSQRVTNSSGAVISTVDLDPWGGDTSRSANAAFQPHTFTTYSRDANGGDDAMMRRYQSALSRFAQPDPYDGSYDLGDPQSFNRYTYVGNDPVNFIDPTGLDPDDPDDVIVTDIWEPMSWDNLPTLLDAPIFVPMTVLTRPQKTLQEKIRENAQTAASQKLKDNEDCRNFIQRLINETQGGMIMSLAGSPASAWGGLNAYAAAAVDGRISASGKTGRNGDSTTFGVTTNYSTISWNKEFYDLSVSDAALHILHESLHLIPGFSDQALGRAASIFADPKKPKSFTLDEKGQNEASRYLNDQINAHCR